MSNTSRKRVASAAPEMAAMMAAPMEILADPRCSGCRPAWGNQPSSDHYLKLTNSLFTHETLFKSGQVDQLDAGTGALRSVLTYLNSDPVSARLGLTRLLASMANALHETSRGAKPSIIFDRRVKGRGGAPTHTTKAGLRAQVNLMFKILTNAGTAPAEASNWLAAQLRKAGVLEKGKSIERRQIVRWRSEMDGKSLSGSDQVYRRVEAVEKRRGWPEDPEKAQSRVRDLIRALQAAGF
jgi:hypothetical protein